MIISNFSVESDKHVLFVTRKVTPENDSYFASTELAKYESFSGVQIAFRVTKNMLVGLYIV